MENDTRGAYFVKQRLLLDICNEIDKCGCSVCGLFGNRNTLDGMPFVYLIKRSRIYILVTESSVGFVYVVRVVSYHSGEVECFDSYFSLEQKAELLQFLHWMYDITL